jgi:DNA modification methylase
MDYAQKETIGNCDLYLGDCLEIMPSLGMANAVVTDPPYNFSAESSGVGGSFFGDITNTSYFFAEALKKMASLFPYSGGVIWQFCSWRTLPAVQKAAFDSGMKIESALVWDKGTLGTGTLAGLRPSCELAVLLRVNGGGIKNRSLPDIWREPPARGPRFHPAEKPVPLVERVIKETSGGIILDPFMGSGTAGAAAAKQGRRFIGIELERRYFDIARKRIKEAAGTKEFAF